MNWLLLPPWDRSLIIAGLLLLVTLSLLRAWRERHGLSRWRITVITTLRLLTLGLITLIAFNPTRILPHEEPERPILTVLLDTSASMAVTDIGGRGRLEAVVAALSAARPGLERHFQLEWRSFDRDARPLAAGDLDRLRAEGLHSDLATALAASISDQAGRRDQAGIVLASDGRETAGEARDMARLALAQGVPLWPLGVGAEVERRDVRISSHASEVLAFPGESVAIAAQVHQVGFPDRVLPVEVRDGDTVLESFELIPDEQGQARLATHVTAPDTGERSLRLIALPLPGEADLSNNERTIHIRTVPGPVRVLLVEGQPHWDSKFVAQSLARHPAIELTALYRLGDDRTFTLVEGADQVAVADQGFPEDFATLSRYDCLFLGRGSDRLLSPAQIDLIRRFVAEHGGSLILHRGRAYEGRHDGLAQLDPVLWAEGAVGNRRMVATSRGLDSPLFALDPGLDAATALAGMRPLDRVQRSAGVKPLATVLAVAGRAEDPQAPVVVAWQPYGLGRVVSINAGGLWRWGFHGQRNDFDEVVYDRLWTGLLRWLQAGGDFLAGHDVAMIAERRLINDEELLRLEIRSRLDEEAGYRPRLVIRGAEEHSAEPAAIGPGSFRAEIGPLAAGDYTVELHNNVGRPERLTMGLTVVSASIEHRNLSADPELMADIATISDGAPLTLDGLGGLPRLVASWRQRQELSERRQTLWTTTLVLLLLFGLLSAEWWLRRRGGLQ